LTLFAAGQANKQFTAKSSENPRRQQQKNFIEQELQICQSGVMLILIDGYNLIRQSDSLRRFDRKSLEAGRRALIARLAEYGGRRNHQVTVVFDGVQHGEAEENRLREGKIDIIFSRHGERADDVIKRIAARTGEEIIVVSSDREITSYVRKLGKTALSSDEFETIVNRVISAEGAPIPEMEDLNDDRERSPKKKGPSRKQPRAQRKAWMKIQKL